MMRQTSAADRENSDLKARPNPAIASGWSALDIVVRNGIQFVVVIALARLLQPEDFGVFALLAFFTGLSVVLLHGGLSTALVQRQDTTRDEESAMFWWNIFASLVVGAVFIAAGPAFAAFFEQPILRWLTVTAALQLVLAAAGETQIALLTREMRFQVLVRAGLIAAPVAGGLAIAAAWLGAGVWALAIYGVALAGLNSLVIWLSTSWRPKFHFHFATVRKFFALGAWVSVGAALDVAFMNSINMLVGKIYGIRALGFYDRAAMLQTNLTMALATVAGRVSLPLFSSKQNDSAALRQSVKLALGCTMLLNVPMLVGMALLAEPIIQVLFGAKWLPAAPLLAIIALCGITYPMHLINVHLAISRGHSRAYAVNECIKKVIGVVCLAAGSGFGVRGLVFGLLAYSVLSLVVYAGPIYRDLQYGPLKQVRDLGGVFFASAVMAGAVLIIRSALPTDPLVTLVVCSLAGGAIYVSVGWLGGFASFRQSFALFEPLLRKPKKS